MNDIVIITSGYFVPKSKIAAFDLDHTLIKPLEDHINNSGPTDWKWLDEKIPKQLRKLDNLGYAIVIFTNQEQKFKINLVWDVVKSLDIPIQAYLIYKKEYKIPNTKAFDLYLTELYDQTKDLIDDDNSFYVGNDLSNVDAKFATNNGLKYYSPEEYFDIKMDKIINVPLIIKEKIKEKEITIPPECSLLKRCPSGYKRAELVELATKCGFKGLDLKKKKEDLCKMIRQKLDEGKDVSDIKYDVDQEGVMLAENYIDTKTGKPIITSVEGWLMSEKYDGVRAIWNGVNFMSRSGNIFEAPGWYKNILPKEALDGELIIGRDQFQETVSIVRKNIPIDSEWALIKYYVFDTPDKNLPIEERINKYQNIVAQVCNKFKPNTRIKKYINECPIKSTTQTILKDEKDLEERYEDILKQHGEGAMLRRPNSLYEGKRSMNLLKYKPLFDAEAIITGYNNGTGRNKDRLGAFSVYLEKNPKIEFRIGGGLSDKIRNEYLTTHPKGTRITFQYAGLTDKGIPRQPRYLRIRK